MKIIFLFIAIFMLLGCSLLDKPKCTDSSKIVRLEVIKVKDGWTTEDLRYIYYTEDGRAFDSYFGSYKIGEDHCFKEEYN